MRIATRCRGFLHAVGILEIAAAPAGSCARWKEVPGPRGRYPGPDRQPPSSPCRRAQAGQRVERGPRCCGKNLDRSRQGTRGREPHNSIPDPPVCAMGNPQTGRRAQRLIPELEYVSRCTGSVRQTVTPPASTRETSNCAATSFRPSWRRRSWISPCHRASRGFCPGELTPAWRGDLCVEIRAKQFDRRFSGCGYVRTGLAFSGFFCVHSYSAAEVTRCSATSS